MPQPGERWRATYEGEVIPREKHPSRGVDFALLADDERAPEEFWEGQGGWVYTKLRGTKEEELLAVVAAARRVLAPQVSLEDAETALFDLDMAVTALDRGRGPQYCHNPQCQECPGDGLG